MTKPRTFEKHPVHLSIVFLMNRVTNQSKDATATCRAYCKLLCCTKIPINADLVEAALNHMLIRLGGEKSRRFNTADRIIIRRAKRHLAEARKAGSNGTGAHSEASEISSNPVP